MITREAVMSVLETRYDYYSARVLMKEACAKAGLGEKDGLDPDGVRALAEAFAAISPKSESVVAALAALAGGKGDGKSEKAEAKAEANAEPATEPEAEAAAEEGGDKPKADKKKKK